MLTPEQERIRDILLDTVALLCKNSLSFNKELKIQGLIAITIDDEDIFLVPINECFQAAEPGIKKEVGSDNGNMGLVPYNQAPDQLTIEEGRRPPTPKRMRMTTPHVSAQSHPTYRQSPSASKSSSSFHSQGTSQVKSEQMEFDNYARSTLSAREQNLFQSGVAGHIKRGFKSTHTAYAGPGNTTVSSTIVTESYTINNPTLQRDDLDEIQIIDDDDNDWNPPDIKPTSVYSDMAVKPTSVYSPPYQKAFAGRGVGRGSVAGRPDLKSKPVYSPPYQKAFTGAGHDSAAGPPDFKPEPVHSPLYQQAFTGRATGRGLDAGRRGSVRGRASFSGCNQGTLKLRKVTG